MSEPIEPDAGATSAPARRRAGGIAWLVAATAALVVIVVLALSGASAIGIRKHLQDGRAALARGKVSLVGGDASHAADDFAQATAAFEAAAGEARSPWLTATSVIPVLGRTPDTVRAVADAGVQTAEAATGLAEAVAGLPGGLGALAPSGGGIPVDNLAGLAGAVARADALTGQALRTLDGTADALVLPPVASARDAARTQLEDLHRQLHAGSLILRGLPAFLGADGPQRFFLGASNPAELRGTGGLIGAYAILTIDGGRMHLTDFRPVQSLPHMDVTQVPSPSKEYSDNFDFFRNGVGFWLNINMTPDFPVAAKAIWLAYREATGQELAGVIVADPFALKALMRVTGPVDVAGTGLKVTEGNVVPFVTNRAYALFDTNEQRKLVLGRVAQSILGSFLGKEGEPLPRLRASIAAFRDGHVKVWSVDPSMEQGLALTSAGGSFSPSGTDALAVVTNSFSGTKLDFFQHRSIAYDVQLGPGGQATASAVVELANDSPTSGYPPYVIGPYKHFSTRAGENVTLVHLYCDVGCDLQGATEGGKPVNLRKLDASGRPFYEDYVRTASGDTARIAANLFLPQAWSGSDTGGAYRLSFVGQTTINQIDLRIVIRAPDGMAFTSASDQLKFEGDHLVYEGHPTGNLDLEATFAPSLPVRIWRDLVDAVS